MEERKVESFEMWCYRRILCINGTQRRTNESVLQEIGENTSILTIIQRRRTSWVGHVLRHQSLLLSVMEGRIEGKRGR